MGKRCDALRGQTRKTMCDILNISVLGTCLDMCSESERNLRIKNKMIHPLEQRVSPNSSSKCILVKSFSRSAAGNMRTCDPKEIRPPYICRRTTNYLVENILFHKSDLSKQSGDLQLDMTTYHFVFDRLRAIRQDMVVQKIDIIENECDFKDLVIHTHVLQVCIKFHLMANYLLGNKNANGADNARRNVNSTSNTPFDTHINFSHLLECLKMILTCFESFYPRRCDSDSCQSDKSDNSTIKNTLRIDMIVVYLLLNIGSYHSYKYGLELDKEAKDSVEVKRAMKMNRLYFERNYVGLFKEVQNLSLLHMLAFQWNVPSIYKEILLVMNTAYSSKNCKFPLSHFEALFALKGIDEDRIKTFFDQHDIKTHCDSNNTLQNLQSAEKNKKDIYICFDKANFNASPSFKMHELLCIDKKLEKQNLLSFFLD